MDKNEEGRDSDDARARAAEAGPGPKTSDSPPEPTLEEHPGLDNDEALPEGKMMTAAGSVGPDGDADDDEQPGRNVSRR